MTDWWPYVAGTDIDFSGVVDFPAGLRLGGDDGTFRLSVAPCITDSVPIRVASEPAPRGGGMVGDPLLDVWQFDVQGWFEVDTPDDIQPAIDLLHQKINMALGWQEISLYAPGWSGAARTMTVQLAGQITVDPRDKGDMTVPERVFTVPLIAADPRRYGVEATVPITTATGVLNTGILPSPFKAVFVGPLTDAELNGPGAGNIIALSSVASGQTITVQTFDPETGTTTLSDNLGTDPMDLFGLLVTDTAEAVQPGTESWTFTKSAGAGTCSMKIRGAW